MGEFSSVTNEELRDKILNQVKALKLPEGSDLAKNIQLLFHENETLKQQVQRNLADESKFENFSTFIKTFFNESAFCFVILDKTGKIIRTNGSFTSLLDFKSDSLNNVYLSELIFNRDHDKFNEWLVSLDDPSAANPIELTLRTREKNHVHCKINKIILTDSLSVLEHFEPSDHFLLTFMDLTNQKHNEIYLNESENRYLNIFENSPIAIWEEDFSLVKSYMDNLRKEGVDDLGKFLDHNPDEIFKMASLIKIKSVNSTSVKILKAKSKQELIQDISRYFYPESLQPLKQEFVQLWNGLTTFQSEIHVKDIEGNKRVFQLHLSVQGQSITNLSSVIISFFDITENVISRNKIKEGEEEKKNILETTPYGFWLVDKKGNILEVNTAYEIMSGYNRIEILDMRIWDFEALEIKEQVELHLQSVKQMGGEKFESKHRKKDGSIFDVEVVVKPAKSKEGKFFVFLRDISKSNLEKELMKARLRINEFATNHTLDELLQNILDEVERLTNSNIGFYHFVEEDQATLSLQMWSTNTVENMCKAAGKGLHYGVNEAGIWAECVHSKKPAIHNDYKNMTGRKGYPEGHAEVIRELVVPVIRGNKIKAILGIGNKPNPYSEIDVDIVSLLADLAWDITEIKRAELELIESESRFRTLVENLPGVVFRCEPYIPWNMQYMSEEIKNICGLESSSFLNSEIKYSDLIHPDDLEYIISTIAEGIENNKTYEIEYRIEHTDGSYHYVTEKGKAIYNDSGLPGYLDGVIIDITEKKKAELELKTSSSRLMTVIENFDGALLMEDGSGRIIVCNSKFCEYFSFNELPETLIGCECSKAIRNARSLFKEPEKFEENTHAYLKELKPVKSELLDMLDGRILERDYQPVYSQDLLIGHLWTYRDLTKKKIVENRIKNSLREKEILLKEIHHRVKNNFQIISSLLNLQLSVSKNLEVNSALKDSQSRIVSMSLVHELMYQSDDLAFIDCNRYFSDLLNYIVRLYGGESKSVSLDLNIAPLKLDIDNVVTCGLILNELATNSMKYAFNDTSNGFMKVIFKKETEDNVVLVYSDNGPGLGNEFNETNIQTLGLKLVSAMVFQLHGNLNINNTENGLQVEIIFKRKNI